MIDTTFQIELINNVEHIQDSNVFTTVIPPMERVKSFSPDQFEEFILEWVISCAKTKYKDVYRIGGVGDMGRGVIGEYRNGEYDYYQCKRYDGKLNPSEYWVEFGKLCYYTYHKDMRMPKKYYIIVSQGLGPKMLNLIKDEKQIRQGLIDSWNSKCKKKISKNKYLKKWYVSDKEDYPKFKKWFLNDKSEATIICDYIYIIEGINECFRCGNKTRVIGLGIENYYEFRCYEDNKNKWIYYNGDIHITSHIYPMPNELLKYIQKNYNYKKRFSKTIKREYYANCCEKCDVLQGDFYVFQEVDSPFFIENEDIARNLKLYRMPLKYDIIVDYTEESIGANDYMIKKYGKMLNVELY